MTETPKPCQVFLTIEMRKPKTHTSQSEATHEMVTREKGVWENVCVESPTKGHTHGRYRTGAGGRVPCTDSVFRRVGVEHCQNRLGWPTRWPKVSLGGRLAFSGGVQLERRRPARRLPDPERSTRVPRQDLCLAVGRFEDGESWGLRIENDSFDGATEEVVIHGLSTQGGREESFLACPTPTEAREMARALTRYANAVQRANEEKGGEG